ncbi:MAG: glycosyltransferase family 4 protein [Pseudomonadales bacterium]
MSKRALRIGVDARPLQNPNTGIGRYTQQLLMRLTQATQHEWFLYSTASESLFDGSPGSVSERRVATTSAAVSTVVSQLLFARWARLDRLDVFWSPRHHLPLFSKAASVVTIHDLVWFKHPETMTFARRLTERALMPRSIRRATKIIAVSESTLEDIVSVAPSAAAKVSVIHEASVFDRSFGNRALGENVRGQEYMLNVGTLEPRKNLERSLRAYRMAAQTDPSVPHLVMVGAPGWGIEPMPAMLASLGLSDRVTYYPNCSDEELAALYRDCRFLLHAALHEGFALPLLEAMSFGKPVVTGNTSAMPEIAGNAGLCVDATAVEDIAKAICKISSDERLYERLCAAAALRATDFSWDKAARQTISVLESARSNAAPS